MIEISDSSLSKDRGEKLVNYAHGRIAVYWIVNLIDRQIEVNTGPDLDGYSSCDDFKPGQTLPVVLDGVEVGQIAVADILPRIVPAAERNSG